MKYKSTSTKAKTGTYKGGAKKMKNTGNFNPKSKQMGKNATYSKISKQHSV